MVYVIDPNVYKEIAGYVDGSNNGHLGAHDNARCVAIRVVGFGVPDVRKCVNHEIAVGGVTGAYYPWQAIGAVCSVGGPVLSVFEVVLVHDGW